MKYKPLIVSAYFMQCDVPAPAYEFSFHPKRRWRLDIAWPENKIAIEVQGGIWMAGGHNRGAQMKKDWEKHNTATAMGWRVLFCEPKDLCTLTMVNLTLRYSMKTTYFTAMVTYSYDKQLEVVHQLQF